MSDFWRLGVGVILLGLAIFLSCNLGSGESDVEQQGALDSGSENESQTEPPTNPQWQVPAPDMATAPATRSPFEGVVRPVFEPPKSAVELTPAISASSPTGTMNDTDQVPKMDDRYRALTRFQVVGSVRRDNGLVPVQPKPSFGGMLSPTGVLHRVIPGDTLQSIAVEYYGDARRYLDIYLANKHLLSNPARLPENIELRIPE